MYIYINTHEIDTNERSHTNSRMNRISRRGKQQQQKMYFVVNYTYFVVVRAPLPPLLLTFSHSRAPIVSLILWRIPYEMSKREKEETRTEKRKRRENNHEERGSKINEWHDPKPFDFLSNQSNRIIFQVCRLHSMWTIYVRYNICMHTCT